MFGAEHLITTMYTRHSNPKELHIQVDMCIHTYSHCIYIHMLHKGASYRPNHISLFAGCSGVPQDCLKGKSRFSAVCRERRTRPASDQRCSCSFRSSWVKIGCTWTLVTLKVETNKANIFKATAYSGVKWAHLGKGVGPLRIPLANRARFPLCPVGTQSPSARPPAGS